MKGSQALTRSSVTADLNCAVKPRAMEEADQDDLPLGHVDSLVDGHLGARTALPLVCSWASGAENLGGYGNRA